MTDAGDAPKIPRDSAQDSPRARDDGGSAARRAGFVVVITVVVTAVVIWLFGARAYDWISQFLCVSRVRPSQLYSSPLPPRRVHQSDVHRANP